MDINFEIFIIILFGIAASGFLVRYFYSSSKKQSCTSCPFYTDGANKNNLKDINKEDNNKKIMGENNDSP